MNKLAGSLELGDLRGTGNLGLEGRSLAAPLVSDFAYPFVDILSVTIGTLTIIAFIWFIFKLITGAIGVMGSGGDKGKLAEARANITYGLVGLIMVVSAIFFAGLIGILLGIEILNVYALIALIRS